MTIPRHRTVSAVAALSAVALTVSSCGGSAPEPDPAAPTCASVLGVDNVNIGWATDWPGWGYQPEPSVKSGFDFDLAGWLAEELCFRPTMVDVVIDEREDRLVHGDVDLVIAAYSKTDERLRRISFAAPYAINEQGVLVRAGDERVTRIEDLDRKSICTIAGSTSLGHLAQARSIRITVVEQPDLTGCRADLAAGSVDAISVDQLLLHGMASQFPEFAVVPGLSFGGQERYGIGFAHGHEGWCEILTDAIQKFITDGRWDSAFATNLDSAADPRVHKPDPHKLESCDNPYDPASSAHDLEPAGADR